MDGTPVSRVSIETEPLPPGLALSPLGRAVPRSRSEITARRLCYGKAKKPRTRIVRGFLFVSRPRVSRVLFSFDESKEGDHFSAACVATRLGAAALVSRG